MNPHNEFLIAYEINRKAMVLDYNASLAPNYVDNEQEIPQSQPTTKSKPLQMAMHKISQYSKDDTYRIRRSAINKEFGAEYGDELEGRAVPPPRSLLSMTLSNWVLIPIQLTKRELSNPNWGFSSNAASMTPMLPRLFWLDQDWTLAKCHRVILTSFFYILRGNL